jgi:hypothetical protein
MRPNHNEYIAIKPLGKDLEKHDAALQSRRALAIKPVKYLLTHLVVCRLFQTCQIPLTVYRHKQTLLIQALALDSRRMLPWLEEGWVIMTIMETWFRIQRVERTMVKFFPSGIGQAISQSVRRELGTIQEA